MTMVQTMSVSDLKTLFDTQATFALIDVREPGEYNASHIPGSSLVPRRQLEFRMLRLVPYQGTLLIVSDDDGRRAPLAAATLEAMGYTQVHVLDGGINRWTTADYPTEWGVNVPSKDFGERMSVEYQVPELHPEEVHARQQRGENLIILDSRTPEEHRRNTIPQARSAPGGELALRISALAPDPDATIVVHCAGRTRSIIGARILQRMGYHNVYDLRNGTMAWSMAGLQLELGSDRLELPAPTPEGLAAAEAFAARVVEEDGVRMLSVEALEALMQQAASENVYLIDVRTEGEYAEGHIAGFQWSPGGQAVQRSDDLVAVKNGHVVFVCDGRVRASIAASWYRQMDFPNVYAVDGGTTAWRQSGRSLIQGKAAEEASGYDEGLQDSLPAGYREAQKQVECVGAEVLKARLDSTSMPVIFVGTSQEFSRGHIPGSRWVSRSWLEPRVGEVAPDRAAPVVLVCDNGLNATLAGATLKTLGYRDVWVLENGMQGWRQAGYVVEEGLSGIMTPPNDVLVMGVERNWADAIHYLRWEEELGHKYEPRQA
jgi:rhodanese-related sulfurtransferase